MNYRHAYHAGNHADVLKHIVLALVIEHLKQKPTPFRVIDTHAGAGLYALDAGPAAKTGEWQSGIGRLIGPGAVPIAAPGDRLLAPYLDVVRAANAAGRLTRYPGSPWLARRLLRAQDRLVVNELHGEERALLARRFQRDGQTKVLGLDGWIALRSLLPPRERRGVILVDPPFEAPGELERLPAALADAVGRFATGVYLLWYPIKDEKAVRRFHDAVRRAGLVKTLAVELLVRPARDPDRLNGSGLIVLNPPHPLARTLEATLPVLHERLAAAAGAGHRLEWICR